MGIDDMMYPGRPIPAELIERYRPQIMEDGSVQMMLIGFKMQSDIHRSMPGARRYPHDLPRSPYYRSSR